MTLQFQFNSLGEFFAMGGYGFYVWLSYAITFAALGLLLWQSKREIRQTLHLAQKENAREMASKNH